MVRVQSGPPTPVPLPSDVPTPVLDFSRRPPPPPPEEAVQNDQEDSFIVLSQPNLDEGKDEDQLLSLDSFISGAVSLDLPSEEIVSNLRMVMAENADLKRTLQENNSTLQTQLQVVKWIEFTVFLGGFRKLNCDFFSRG